MTGEKIYSNYANNQKQLEEKTRFCKILKQMRRGKDEVLSVIKQFFNGSQDTCSIVLLFPCVLLPAGDHYPEFSELDN